MAWETDDAAMTRRRDLEAHRATLDEIHGIMNSMKSLAYMETRKLAGLLDAQHAVVEGIEAVAADFLGFYPETLAGSEKATDVHVLVGSERGFCGDFNETLARYLDTHLEQTAMESPFLIAVGRKLHPLLESKSRVPAIIDGASTVDEVAEVIKRLVDAIAALQMRHGPLSVSVLHHTVDASGIAFDRLVPPFERFRNGRQRFPYPPVMNLQPQAFFLELTDQYVFAALHEVLYASLMAENHRRVRHLEGAVRHLDDRSCALRRKCNALRQEEIIEEIEIILLSASLFDHESGERR
ncbi:MAG: F0F1 ATP synthase subunit gamma [Gammaproteobacteria bacterium]|nr:F0F1 ATP synthase subunit gamma [Gammaproteobacteria bacterium]